jgi:hypothetical protein
VLYEGTCFGELCESLPRLDLTMNIRFTCTLQPIAAVFLLCHRGFDAVAVRFFWVYKAWGPGGRPAFPAPAPTLWRPHTWSPTLPTLGVRARFRLQ